MRLIAILVAGLLSASPVGASPNDPASAEAGHELYGVFCSSCHGPEGRGDGPFGATLAVPPADLTRIAARNGGRFPEFEVMRRIDGRAEVPGHGVLMPIFGALFDNGIAITRAETGQPIFTTRSIADLTAWIESVQVAR